MPQPGILGLAPPDSDDWHAGRITARPAPWTRTRGSRPANRTAPWFGGWRRTATRTPWSWTTASRITSPAWPGDPVTAGCPRTPAEDGLLPTLPPAEAARLAG